MNQPELFLNTGTGTAIEYMRETMFAGFDESKRKVGVLFTDGASMDPTQTLNVSLCYIHTGPLGEPVKS